MLRYNQYTVLYRYMLYEIQILQKVLFGRTLSPWREILECRILSWAPAQRVPAQRAAMKKKSMEVNLYRDHSMHRPRARSCMPAREITRSPSRTENGRNWDAVELGGGEGERFPRWRKSHSGRYNCEQLPTHVYTRCDTSIFASCQGRSLIRVKTDIERLSLDRLFSS